MSVSPQGDESAVFRLFWFEVAAELLFVAISDTMEVGEVVSEELDTLPEVDEDEDEELELVDVRMVDEVTEVGGVLADDSRELNEGGEPVAS